MKDIVLLNTRTAFIVLLLGNTAFALQPQPPVRVLTDSKQRTVQRVQKNVSDLLVSQGLEDSVAMNKVNALFPDDALHIDTKIKHLQDHPAIALKSDDIEKSLAKRALFDRSLDLDAYDALVGFVQETGKKVLDDKALKAVQQIATLNRSLS